MPQATEEHTPTKTNKAGRQRRTGLVSGVRHPRTPRDRLSSMALRVRKRASQVGPSGAGRRLLPQLCEAAETTIPCGTHSTGHCWKRSRRNRGEASFRTVTSGGRPAAPSLEQLESWIIILITRTCLAVPRAGRPAHARFDTRLWTRSLASVKSAQSVEPVQLGVRRALPQASCRPWLAAPGAAALPPVVLMCCRSGPSLSWAQS